MDIFWIPFFFFFNVMSTLSSILFWDLTLLVCHIGFLRSLFLFFHSLIFDGIHSFVHMSIHTLIHPFIHSPIHTFILLSTHLSTHPIASQEIVHKNKIFTLLCAFEHLDFDYHLMDGWLNEDLSQEISRSVCLLVHLVAVHKLWEMGPDLSISTQVEQKRT